ncbi:MAG: geranylgeranyl reductase family protein [Nitrospiria bacterium]
MVYDLIVIGMGPAGSTAAYVAASQGLSVLGLDQAHFPRYKTCGGGLSPKIQKLFPIQNEPFIERTIHSLRLSFLSRKETFYFDQPISYMVMREVFDQVLVNRAIKAGARFQAGVKVRQIEEKKEGVIVHTDRESFEGKLAIGADGALGITTRILNPDLKLKNAPGIEGEIKDTVGIGSSTIEIEVGHTPSGYGWIFPKNELFSVGVAGFQGTRSVKGSYRNYLSSILSRNGRSFKETGHPIPIYTSRKLRLSTNRLLLAGDAGHLVDPFFGEGIYYAMRSGEIAGEFSKKMIEDKVPGVEYQKKIENEFYPDFIGAKRLAGLVYRFPKIFFNLTVKHPGVIQLYVDVLSGKQAYRTFLSTVLKTALLKSIGR